MTQREIIRNNLNKSDWEITKDKCDSTRAHRQHLAANRKHENKRKIYCTNVHMRIIEILITLMYKLSAVTAAVTMHRHKPSAGIWYVGVAASRIFIQEYSRLDFHALLTVPHCKIQNICQSGFEKLVFLEARYHCECSLALY